MEYKNLTMKKDLIKCNRCQKEIEVSKSITLKIYYRDRVNGKAVTKSYLGQFCCGECAGNEQMSMEG